MTGLPQGWASPTIKSITGIKMGKTVLSKELTPSGLPVYSAGAEDKPWGYLDGHAATCQQGTVVVSARGSIGFPKLPKHSEFISTQTTIAVTPTDAVVPEFLLQALKRLDYGELSSGAAIPMLTVGKLGPIEIPLPPLPEQRRIVRKLDTLSARTTTARTHLTAIAKLVERYKLALYLNIFSGPQAQIELGEIAKVGTGATPKKGVAQYYENGTVPWVTSGAVNNKRVTAPSSYITDRAIQETNCKLFPAGSLLMAMYGEGKTRGQVARLEIDAATNQALAVIHEVDTSKVDQEYLFRFLDSIYLEIRDQAAGGVQPNLSLGKVKSFKIPLPALDEQRETVRRIETTFAKIDGLAAEAAQALKLTDRLDKHLLAKAFAGELVPQDPNDEPAETLLGRIRAEPRPLPR